MTYILHLETATKVCSTAISLDGKLIALKEIEEEGYSHGENLTVLIQSVVQDAGITLKDLAAVSVASGPGSYTGLRIGGATAKGMCYALNIPLIAIDALTALAALGAELHSNVNLCPVIDARRMEVYNAIYNSALTQLKPISADVITEESYSEYEPFVFFGDGAQKLQALWESRNLSIDTSIKCSAKGQTMLAFEAFKEKRFEDLAYWEPYYLKDFVAGKKKQ